MQIVWGYRNPGTQGADSPFEAQVDGVVLVSPGTTLGYIRSADCRPSPGQARVFSGQLTEVAQVNGPMVLPGCRLEYGHATDWSVPPTVLPWSAASSFSVDGVTLVPTAPVRRASAGFLCSGIF